MLQRKFIFVFCRLLLEEVKKLHKWLLVIEELGNLKQLSITRFDSGLRKPQCYFLLYSGEELIPRFYFYRSTKMRLAVSRGILGQSMPLHLIQMAEGEWRLSKFSLHFIFISHFDHALYLNACTASQVVVKMATLGCITLMQTTIISECNSVDRALCS